MDSSYKIVRLRMTMIVFILCPFFTLQNLQLLAWIILTIFFLTTVQTFCFPQIIPDFDGPHFYVRGNFLQNLILHS